MNTSLPPPFSVPALADPLAATPGGALTLPAPLAADAGFATAFAQFLGQLPVGSPAPASTAPALLPGGTAPTVAPTLGARSLAALATATVATGASPLSSFTPASLVAAPAPAENSPALPAGVTPASRGNAPTLATTTAPNAPLTQFSSPGLRPAWTTPAATSGLTAPENPPASVGLPPAIGDSAAGPVAANATKLTATVATLLPPPSGAATSVTPPAPSPASAVAAPGGLAPVATAPAFAGSTPAGTPAASTLSAAPARRESSAAPMRSVTLRPGEPVAAPASEPSLQPWVPVASFSASELSNASANGASVGPALVATLAPAERVALETTTGLDRTALENLVALLVPSLPTAPAPVPTRLSTDADPALASPGDRNAAAPRAVAAVAILSTRPTDSAAATAPAPERPVTPEQGGAIPAWTGSRPATPAVVELRSAPETNSSRVQPRESGRIQSAASVAALVETTAFVGAEVQTATGARLALRPAAHGSVTLEMQPEANSAARELELVPAFAETSSGSKKMFLSDSRQLFATDSASAGIAVAQSPLDMPSTLIAPAAPAASTTEWMASAVPVIEAIEVQSDQPAEVTARAAAAVHAVVEVAEAQAASRLQPVPAVTLRFDFHGEPLSVRVELRDGEVRTEFRTASPELSSALAHEWRAIAPQAEAGARLADPVFTAQPRTADGGATTGGEQQFSQHRPSGQLPEPFAAARSGRAAPSASAPAAATEVASAPTGAVRPATSRRLSVLA